MKSTYLATQLEPDAFLAFGIRAAKRGTSKSGLLRALVTDFLEKEDKAKVKPKGGNMRKGGTV